MKIGLIAEKTGVSRDTIRLYEKMGLLTGVTRPHKYNNYKEYAESNVDRVKMIITLKRLGLSLKECKKVFDAIIDKGYNDEFKKTFLACKLKEIDSKIDELKQLKNILKQYMNSGCDNEGIIDKIKGPE
jgi:DNA-binding transcriptional MerR regulator